MTSQSTCDVLTFNLNNPSRERAERQLGYLAARSEPVLVLTETADSAGCRFLEERFTAAGYSVTFPRPEQRGERGVMIVSRLVTRPLETGVDYLPHRAVGVTVDTDEGPLDVIGLYVPSRDASPAKTDRKRRFLEVCRHGLLSAEGDVRRLVIGDFNVLEPSHVPRYRFFAPFEYEFYNWFGLAGYEDAFRQLHPDAREYSWVGKTGDGYRYDHAHVSMPLAGAVGGCSYVHEPRTGQDRLTDHSALTVHFTIAPVRVLETTDPTCAEPIPALF
jgi:exodeoxyribonuclease-3